MNNDTIDAEHRQLAVAEPATQANVSLFTGEPSQVIAQAVKVADALKAVVQSKGLVKKIQGREFIEVAGWQTLGAMTRVTPFCEWTRETADGWEARVVVKNAQGVEIGAAEAECTRKENTWKSRDGYAIRSMAQTRATSKALRMVLGFIVVLAGYKDTPAEEMGGGEYEPPAPEPLPGPTPREQAHLDAIEAVLAACRQVNVKAPARGVLDGKSVVELLAYRDRVLAARAGDSKPAGAPPASQPTQEPLAAAASATEPANASEFPGPGGPPMSLKTQRHLFAVLGELGYDTKNGEHRGWLSSLGLGPHADAIESFALLSEAQAAFLARKAVEEREDLKWECPACGTFDKSKHSANCPERDFTA